MTEAEQAVARLEETLMALEGTIGGTEAVTAAFRAEMEEAAGSMRGAGAEAGSLARTFGSSLKGAVNDLIFDGARLSEVLTGVGRGLTNGVLTAAMRPVQDALGGALGGLFGGAFAKGAAFSSGQVRAFASGGVIDGPTRFPMRGGRVGLMGEAGPEAIMPLARGPDGRLGVRAGGGGRPVQVVVNISTPDVEGFRRSRSQIAAELGRALGQGRRNQ
ncbi:phage tail tape measure protein [Halovulum dunhuangense]|uniref:Phage tail tape measure protein n=1 Tax=Halovulum dunhuangense TaxID=1505036 RepID=A0A849L6Z6_9RHOB|nr:phage tail tape measure protein [Halovulum dunhuangense]NNU81912.1 phage tail tape measure protein [Halovulum dunhuangense]